MIPARCIARSVSGLAAPYARGIYAGPGRGGEHLFMPSPSALRWRANLEHER